MTYQLLAGTTRDYMLINPLSLHETTRGWWVGNFPVHGGFLDQ
ncbi:MAG: hypothetical protein ACXAEU_01975 [Candidatus Hodarchaeales archaeon]